MSIYLSVKREFSEMAQSAEATVEVTNPPHIVVTATTELASPSVAKGFSTYMQSAMITFIGVLALAIPGWMLQQGADENIAAACGTVLAAIAALLTDRLRKGRTEQANVLANNAKDLAMQKIAYGSVEKDVGEIVFGDDHDPFPDGTNEAEPVDPEDDDYVEPDPAVHEVHDLHGGTES